ncbi:MAG: hypothetical protein PWP04_1883 [Candidatus Atribacteria bacterium]|nr:hypothetical protein [Candidatus Atribacteria bacterium]
MAKRLIPARRERSVSPARRLWDLFDLRSDLDSIFDELMETPLLTQPFLGGGFPAVDVAENENEIIVKAEVPGLDPKDVDVKVSEDAVEIRGETKDELEEKDAGYYRRERYYGSFERVINLPTKVKEDQVKATYKNGILTITLPKTEPSKPKARKVEIEVSK